MFPPTPRETPGIAWRPAGQLELLRRLAAQPPLEFPDGPTGDARDYHADVLAYLLPGYADRYRDGGGSLWIRRT